MHVVQWPDLSNILINLNQDIVSLWSRAAKNGPWSLYKVVVTENYLNNSDFDGIIMITLDTKSCFQVIWNNRSITPTTQKVLWNGRGGGGLRTSAIGRRGRLVIQKFRPWNISLWVFFSNYHKFGEKIVYTVRVKCAGVWRIVVGP